MAQRIPNLKADIFRNTHHASVVAILGADAPPIETQGTRFYNIDRWTARFFIREMTTWVKRNPGQRPESKDVFDWVDTANHEPVKGRKIVTANIPDNITLHLSQALIGGAYHEALHTRYSCRRDLKLKEMENIIYPNWDNVPDWSILEAMLQEWSNVIEDIRIERRGCAEYPGIHMKLEHLQDFILEQEDNTQWGALTAVMMTFRDIGLGYSTRLQDERLLEYQVNHPLAYQMVTDGPLTKYLEEAVNLSDLDDLGCLRLAMRIVTHIHSLATEQDSQTPTEELQEAESSGEGEDGDGIGLGIGGDENEDSDTESNLALPFRGGHEYEEGGSSYWKDISNEMIQDETARVKELGDILSNAIIQATKKQMLSLESGEAPWNPFDPGLDTIDFVKPSSHGNDQQRAIEILASIKAESNFIRNKIRRLIYAQQERTIYHGVKKGTALSERMLVDTYTSLQANQYPRRAYQKPSDIRDVDFSAAIVLDQSDSMRWDGKLIDATRCMLAIAEPLESLQYPVLAIGFRDGKPNRNAVVGSGYHRYDGVHIDIFKNFNEKLRPSLWRFACTRGVGGTPMADGIHYGLEMLRQRKEKKRILFVLTDGQPNFGHQPVMQYLMRKAYEEGILVVGVGIGVDARYVVDVFESHVWAQDIKEMPKMLIQLLERLLL